LDAILLAVSGGSLSAFADLYRISSPALFRCVLKVVRNAPEADDILQAVYVKACNRAKQYDARKGRAIGWLMGIARNAAVDAMLASKRRPSQRHGINAETEDPFALIASTQPHADEVLSAKRIAEAVQRCVAQLSNDQRESLTLAYYYGMSHAEISAQMRRPLGTVKSCIRRAMAAMQADLSDFR